MARSLRDKRDSGGHEERKMELQQLRYFLAVAKHGSFSKAAADCYVSQPALSEQIQKLESEVGKILFDRTHRQIVPTVEGRLLIEQAKRILDQVKEAKLQVQGSDGTASGTVTVGILPTIAPYFVPQILRTFSKACPLVQIMVHEDLTAHLVHMVESGELDFGIATLPIKENSFEIERLFTEELLLAIPARHRLAKKSNIRVADLHNERFILMKEGHCLGDQALVFCHRHDFRPRIVMRSGQIGTILSLVRSRLGISLVPRMARDAKLVSVAYRSLAAPKPTRTIIVFWRSKSTHNKAVQEFLKHLRQASKAFLKSAEPPKAR
jgi:LysR family hydrogen peroxide-inducible transcriptional activator